MSLTDIGEQYRTEQENLHRIAATRLAGVFPSLDLKDLDRSAPGWVFAVERVTADYHRQSQELAADMYSDWRREAGASNRVSFVYSDLNGGKLRASLTYEGVYAGKRALSQGARIPDVAQMLFAHTSGIALRHGRDGGRELVQLTGAADRSTTGSGFLRMTSGKPCGFCAMKALTVYRSEAIAGQDYHDHDRCYAVPRMPDALPDGYRDQMGHFKQVYDESVVLRRGPTGGYLTDVKATIRNMSRALRAG